MTKWLQVSDYWKLWLHPHTLPYLLPGENITVKKISSKKDQTKSQTKFSFFYIYCSGPNNVRQILKFSYRNIQYLTSARYWKYIQVFCLNRTPFFSKVLLDLSCPIPSLTDMKVEKMVLKAGNFQQILKFQQSHLQKNLESSKELISSLSNLT